MDGTLTIYLNVFVCWLTYAEGILQFDVELLRLSATGLLLVAKNGSCLGRRRMNRPSVVLTRVCFLSPCSLDFARLLASSFHAFIVPVKDQKAVIDTEGIAPGDDYFVVFMDSYDGTVSVHAPFASNGHDARPLTLLSAPHVLFPLSLLGLLAFF